MFNRIAPQAAALCLSALFTVAMLVSMDQLATQQHAVPVASDSTPVQVVVVTGQRIRS